jgi:hypothetical protein
MSLSTRPAASAATDADEAGPSGWVPAPHVIVLGRIRRHLAVPRKRGTVTGMGELEVLDEINRLLDADGDTTVNTSMRLPSTLRDAASLAVRHLGVADSTTSLTATALRRVLETAVTEAALEAHFAKHPHARPSLSEVALALAAQDGSPLADRPELLERAATQVLARHPDADADDVLLWAEAQLAAYA